MILTCPECQTQYKLDPAMLGNAGRTVRCVGCNHTWFQKSQNTAEAAVPPQTLAAALDTILEQDDAVFESILSGVGARTDSPSPAPAPAPVFAVEKGGKRPEVSLPIVTHNPLDVSAPVFGGLVFALCLFFTLIVLFLAREPVMRHWPQTALLYEAMGFDSLAPGEGLRLSEIIAEHRIDSRDKVLVVEGKMANMTEKAIAYPALHVTLKDSRDGVMKTWDLKPSASQIASGDIVPVKLQLSDAPEDGATIELRVMEKR